MNSPDTHRRESGYALLLVVLLAALVLVALSVVVPRILTQGQREKEDELIFRGDQYRKAIGRFYGKFGRFPNTIQELLRTNDRSFLRREYADPMDPEGKWRLIRVAPNGALIGSVTRRVPAPGGQEEGGEEGNGEEAGGGEEETPPADADAGDDSTLPIAGVASRSRARSIKVYQGYEHYYQWEFIFEFTPQGGAGTPGQAPRPPGQGQGQGQGPGGPAPPQER